MQSRTVSKKRGPWVPCPPTMSPEMSLAAVDYWLLLTCSLIPLTNNCLKVS